jgi:hypothetical protein
MKPTPASPFYAPARWEGALIATGAFIGYLLLAHLFGEGRGTAAGGFLTSFAIALRICWPLRRQMWFWLAMIGLGALHVFALVVFDWSAAADWTGLTYSPFILADVTLLLTIIYFIYRSIYGAPAQLVIEPEPRYAEDSD